MTRRGSLVALVLLAASAQAAEPGLPIHPGDRVLFLGDSITEQYQYSTYIELYLTTRFPRREHDVRQRRHRRRHGHRRGRPLRDARPGREADGRHHRLRHERRRLRRVRPEAGRAVRQNTDAMLAAAKKAGVRVALISPNAVEVRGQAASELDLKTYLETQKQFYAPLKELAAKYGVPFVDQYAVTRKVLEKMAADERQAVKPFPDGVHTNPAGGLLMAHTILVGLQAPAEVSRVTSRRCQERASNGERLQGRRTRKSRPTM